MSDVTYRIGNPPTQADRKHQKHHRGWAFWLDFTLSGIQEFTWMTAFLLLTLAPLLTGHR